MMYDKFSLLHPSFNMHVNVLSDSFGSVRGNLNQMLNIYLYGTLKSGICEYSLSTINILI